jgi:hypothetical protein
MRQNTKTIIGSAVTTTTTASSFSAQFDTFGFNFAKVVFFAPVTEALPTTGFTIVESDTSGGTTNSITGYTQNTDWTAITSTNSTDTAKLILAVDLRGRKRYLKATGTVTTGITVASAKWICELSNPGDGISNATEAGAANAVGL